MPEESPSRRRARRLYERIDALAEALAAAGADPALATRLLASARSAAVDAVALDVVLTRPRMLAPEEAPAAGSDAPAGEPPVELAA